MTADAETRAAPVFAVIGHPIGHSKSPAIHEAFGAALGVGLSYERLLAPLDGFAATVQAFADRGGKGLNVTLPFKGEALALASRASERARLAGAANTLTLSAAGIAADNTDGIGLVTDLADRWGFALAGADVLLIGAGGAARGVLQPLLQAGIASLTIANRTPDKASALAALARQGATGTGCRIDACALASLADWRPAADAAPGRLVLNATASGLHAQGLDLAPAVFAGATLAYDMVYADSATPFMRQALAAGCARAVDGLGMLVEQAAESFRIWHGRRPATEVVYKQLRVA